MPKATPTASRRVIHWFRTDLRVHDAPALTHALNIEGIEAFYPIWCFDSAYVWKHVVGINRWQFLLQSMSATSSALTALNPDQKMFVIRGSPEDVLPVAIESWGITDLVWEKDGSGYAKTRDTAIQNLINAKFPHVTIHTIAGHHLVDPEEVVKKNGGKAIGTLAQWKKAADKVGPVPRPLPPPTSLPSPGPLTLRPHLVDAIKDKQEQGTEIGLGEKSLGEASLFGREGGASTSAGGKGKAKGKAKVKEEEEETKETKPKGKGNGSAKGKGKVGRPVAILRGENLNGDIMDMDKFNCFDDIDGPDHDFSVPTLDSLGLPAGTTTITGGEPSALARLSNFLSDPSRVATFSKPATAPTSLEPSTTLLSPYLKFGCLSVREFWWRCKEVVDGYKAKKGEKVTGEPENIFGQLEFRDMYACTEYCTPHFQQIRGNPFSRYIDWSLQNQHTPSGDIILPRPSGSSRDEEWFLRWKTGQTGFPWIDAVMRQLKQEGWIHHLARHSVACFLTRGQCYISWERGAEVFDQWLLDWDPCSNPGNWMWLSCSAYFSQYFRVYGLTSWPMKTDKHGLLVRKYCPELNGFPDKYIYEPYKAPLATQKQANCIIGTDYPSPMLDEQFEKNKCIARLKIAFQAGYHGADKVVLEGRAEAMLRDMYKEQHGDEEDAGKEEKGGKMDKEGAAGEGTKVGAASPGKKRKIVEEDSVDSGPMDAFVKKKAKKQ